METISHLTFIVQDLEKSADLFKTIFEAKEVYSSGNHFHSLTKEKFLMIDKLWIALMEGESLPTKSYNHSAFKIKESEYGTYLKRIQQLGIEIKQGRKRIAGEAQSIYFYDYDNHLFELHTGTLEDRLKAYGVY